MRVCICHKNKTFGDYQKYQPAFNKLTWRQSVFFYIAVQNRRNTACQTKMRREQKYRPHKNMNEKREARCNRPSFAEAGFVEDRQNSYQKQIGENNRGFHIA
jgi:hypothetical protein